VTAGIMAIVDQKRKAAGRPVLGFANPALYAASPSAFHDIADGSRATKAVVRTDFVNAADDSDGLVTTLRALGDTGTLTSTPGYDDTTGRGTPAGQAFVSALSAATP
jgi:hypothetical protein